MSETKTDNETTEKDLYDSSTGDYDSSTVDDTSTPRRPENSEELQRKYLHMIKMCKVSSVRELVDGNVGFDVNCKNYRGTTGLNLAIEVNCEQMINLLLSRPELEIGDSLMHAIRHNRYPTVIKLLDILQVKSPDTVELGYEHSAEFPQYLTPIMLAAQCGYHQIISLLLKRGHVIQTPHRAGCLCKKVCKSSAQLENGLEAADLKLSMFRALSNPFYIYLTSEDPVLTTFRLSEELREHGTVNRLFRSDYELLDLQTRKFAVDLIGLCRSSAEVKLMLAQDEGCDLSSPFPYRRLAMAVDLKQKEFVAHASVQQILEVAWAGNWYEWRHRPSTTAYGAGAVLTRVSLLPWIAVLYLFAPHSDGGRYYGLPVNRMINYLASYTVFLVVLTWANNLEKTTGAECTGGGGVQLALVLKTIIMLYAMSFVVRAVELVAAQGPRRFFGEPWNVYDCVNLCLMAATAACWWSSFVDARATAAVTERKYWPSSHPTLVGEGLLAVVTVLSFLRLLFLCQLSYTLGPLQVSLGKMTADFARLAAVLGIVIAAFTAGLCRFYQYYEGMVRVDPDTGHETAQDQSFVNVYSTLKTLFWSLFCMASSNAGTVVIENLFTVDGVPSVHNHHYVTQAVGTLLYSVFQALSVVFILNMLIATMTNTFQRVTGNSYVEWVFGRTEVYLSFSVLHSDLPPPLNFVSSARCVVNVFTYMEKYCAAIYSAFSGMPPSKKSNHTDDNIDNDYRELMHKLGRRYFRYRQQSAENVRKGFLACG